MCTKFILKLLFVEYPSIINLSNILFILSYGFFDDKNIFSVRVIYFIRPVASSMMHKLYLIALLFFFTI
jgi:hypothetical protein